MFPSGEYILFCQLGHRQGHELQKMQIKTVTLNQIGLRELLEIYHQYDL